jgi:hypothetical protein
MAIASYFARLARRPVAAAIALAPPHRPFRSFEASPGFMAVDGAGPPRAAYRGHPESSPEFQPPEGVRSAPPTANEPTAGAQERGPAPPPSPSRDRPAEGTAVGSRGKHPPADGTAEIPSRPPLTATPLPEPAGLVQPGPEQGRPAHAMGEPSPAVDGTEPSREKTRPGGWGDRRSAEPPGFRSAPEGHRPRSTGPQAFTSEGRPIAAPGVRPETPVAAEPSPRIDRSRLKPGTIPGDLEGSRTLAPGRWAPVVSGRGGEGSARDDSSRPGMVHIGAIEIEIVQPPPPRAPAARPTLTRPANPSATRLARGFSSRYGLQQE